MSVLSSVKKVFTFTLAVQFALSCPSSAFAATSIANEVARATVYGAQIERSLTAIEDGRRQAPRDRWDPQYVVDKVGIDPGAQFQFVRENVAWVPYHGSLRGPVGVLMDRSANALDMALLVADLMSRSGHKVRLAHGKLPNDVVDKLWTVFEANASATRSSLRQANAEARAAQLSPEPVQEGDDAKLPAPSAAAEVTAPAKPAAPAAKSEGQPSQAAAAGDAGGLASPFKPIGGPGSIFEQFAKSEPPAATDNAEAADLYELNKSAAEQQLAQASASRENAANELDSRTSGQSGRLLQLLQASADPTRQEKERERAKAALADHWWVQAEQNGRWIDYDVLDPDGKPGKALTRADETTAPGSLAPDQKHRVSLRIVAEQLRDGKLVESSVFDHEFEPSQVIGKRIALRQLPLLWPADWEAITPDDVQEKLFAALLTQKEWMPSLTVGNEAFQQSSIIDTGTVNPDPQPRSNPFLSLAFPAAGKVGRIADLFDQMLDEQATPEEREAEKQAGEKPRAEGELTAEWLEYTIHVPGEKPRTIRREVFDILTPAVRRSGDFSKFRLGEDQRLARAGGMMTESDLVILPCWPSAAYLADKTAELALLNKPVLQELTRDPFGKSPPNSIEMFSKMTSMAGPAYLYSMLRSEVQETIGSVFIDRPQIVAQHGVLTRVGPGELTAKAALDVVENGVGADPFGDDAFQLRLTQGVADTNAEAIALSGNKENVGEAFQLAATTLEWTVFRPEDRDKLNKLGLPADLTARLLSDLEAGHAVVSPGGSASLDERAGWWRIDLATGTTLGMGNRGWGASLVEYAFQLTIQVMMAQIACMAFNTAAAARDWGAKKLGIDGDDESPPPENADKNSPDKKPANKTSNVNPPSDNRDTRSPTNETPPPRNNPPPRNSNPPPTAANGPKTQPSGDSGNSNPAPPTPPPPPAEPTSSQKEPRPDPFETESKELSGGGAPKRETAPQTPSKPDVTHVEAREKSKSSDADAAPKTSPQNDSARLEEIRSETDQRKAADQEYKDAIAHYEADPTPENQAAIAAAKAAYDSARDLELKAWARVGGKGLPPEEEGQTGDPAQDPPAGGITTQSIDRAGAQTPAVAQTDGGIVDSSRASPVMSNGSYAGPQSVAPASDAPPAQASRAVSGAGSAGSWKTADAGRGQSNLQPIGGPPAQTSQSPTSSSAGARHPLTMSLTGAPPQSPVESGSRQAGEPRRKLAANQTGDTSAKEREKNAEEGRQKIKTWARNCVSQALLESIAGLSTAWIHSRFIEGAKVPTWNNRAKNAGPPTPMHIPPGTSINPNADTHPRTADNGSKPSTDRSPADGGSKQNSSTPPSSPPSTSSPSSTVPTGPESSPPGTTKTASNGKQSQSETGSDAPPTQRSPGNSRDPAAGSKPAPSSGDAVTQRKPDFEDDQLPSNYPNGPKAPDKVAQSDAPSTQRSPGNGVDPMAQTERSPVPPTQRAPDPMAPTERAPVPPTQRAPDPMAQTERSPVPPTQRAPDPMAQTERSPVPPTQRAPDPMAQTERSPVPPTQRAPDPMAQTERSPVPPTQRAPDPIARTERAPVPPTQRAPDPMAPTERAPVPPTQRAPDPMAQTERSPVPPTQRAPDPMAQTERSPVPPTQRAPDPMAQTERSPVPPTQRAPDPMAPTERAPGPPTQRAPSSSDAATQRKPSFEDDQLPSNYPNGPKAPDKVAQSDAPPTQRSPGNDVDPMAPTELSPGPPTQRAPDPMAPTERAPGPPTQRAPSSGDAATQRKPSFEDDQLPSNYPNGPKAPDKVAQSDAPPTQRSPSSNRDPASGSKPPPSSGDAVTQRKPSFEDDQLPSNYPNGPKAPDKVAQSDAPPTQRVPQSEAMEPTERSPVPPTQRAPDPMAQTERSPVPPTQRAPDPMAQTERSPVPPTQRAPDPMAPTERAPGNAVSPMAKSTATPGKPLQLPETAQSGPATKPGVGPGPETAPTQRVPQSEAMAPTERSPVPPTQRAPDPMAQTERSPVPPTQRAPDPMAPTERAPGNAVSPMAKSTATPGKPLQLPETAQSGPATKPGVGPGPETAPTQRVPQSEARAPTERSPVPPTQRAPDPMAPTERAPGNAVSPMAKSTATPGKPLQLPETAQSGPATKPGVGPGPETAPTQRVPQSEAMAQTERSPVPPTQRAPDPMAPTERAPGNAVSPMAKSTATPGKPLQPEGAPKAAPQNDVGKYSDDYLASMNCEVEAFKKLQDDPQSLENKKVFQEARREADVHRIEATRGEREARVEAQKKYQEADAAFDAAKAAYDEAQKSADPVVQAQAEKRYHDAYGRLDKANDDYNKAHMKEVDAWAKAGGIGGAPPKDVPAGNAAKAPSPPTPSLAGTRPVQDPGARSPSANLAQPGDYGAANATLTMGLSNLAGVIQNGP